MDFNINDLEQMGITVDGDDEYKSFTYSKSVDKNMTSNILEFCLQRIKKMCGATYWNCIHVYITGFDKITNEEYCISNHTVDIPFRNVSIIDIQKAFWIIFDTLLEEPKDSDVYYTRFDYYNAINIYGNISNSTYGQLYNGFINVVVGNHTYNNVEVTNGKFTVEINDLSNYNVSINNVTIIEASINDNYNLENVTFANYFIINSAGSSINISSVTEKYGAVVVIPVISENVTALIATVYTLDGQVVSNINMHLIVRD